MSWTTLPLEAADVRVYLGIDGTTGQFSNAVIGSNIRAAAALLERATSRQFEPQTATKKFTSEGRSYIAIPDLRTASAVSLQSSALTADTSYWLVEDALHSGVYIGVQFRAFGRSSFLSNPEWFDRNLDRTWGRYGTSSLPNDLSITGDWGHVPFPPEFLHAVKILAGFYTRRPASVLADSAITPEGTELRYSRLPVEVREFIDAWQAGDQVAVIG